MPSGARLDWMGERLIARVEAAAREAVNETVEDAADDARATHTWINRPRLQLESEIGTEHADPADRNPTARFGFGRRRGFYGLFHEEGTVHEHQYPALRPAADRIFPTLGTKIAMKLRGWLR